MKRGKLIVIEGTDASGKATQTKLLLGRLNQEGYATESMSFPRYETPTGQVVKMYLGKPPYLQEFGPSNSVDPKIASTWYALDRLAAKPEIENILMSGMNLAVDRYVESNLAHQGGKMVPKQRESFFEWGHTFEYGILGLPIPSIVVFLHMPYKIGMELKKGMKEAPDGHESNEEHLRSAEETYLELTRKYGWEKVICTKAGSIDNLRTPEDIGKEVFNKVVRIFK